MPSLEDTPKLVPKTSPSGSDLVPIFDVTEAGNARNKKATLSAVTAAGIAALPGPYTDDIEAAVGGVAIGGPYILDSAGLYLITIRVA